MIAYTPSQAIGPAIERTRQFLFRPFAWGRFFKLALVATITEGGVSSCNQHSGRGNGGMHLPQHMPHPHWPAAPMMISAAIAMGLLVILVSIWIAYLVIRLRFSFFDCVLRLEDRIRPAWARYHRQAVRYLLLSICLDAAFWLALIWAGISLFRRYQPLFESLFSGQKPGIMPFLPVIGLALLALLVLGLIHAFLEAAMSTFVLPRMALENASIGEALGEIWSDFELEPGSYLLFLILRFLLSVGAGIAVAIMLFLPAAAVFALGAIVALLLKSVPAPTLALLAAPGGFLVFAGFLLASIAAAGIIGTFRRNYSLLYYGGRYPLLGSFLNPPPPAAAPPSPGFPPQTP